MKKVIMLIIAAVGLVAALYAYSHFMKCRVCMNDENRKKCYSLPNNAWRDYSVPIIHKDGKAYATYRCQSGHKFLVDLGE